MLSEKELIYIGAILLWQIWQSPTIGGRKVEAIAAAKEIYNKIFKEDE